MFNLLIPVSLNDSQTLHAGIGPSRKKPMSSKLFTFSYLINIMTQRATLSGQPPQSLSNSLSALRAFMTDLGFNSDSPIGSNLRVSYYRRITEHLTNLREKGHSTRYIANRKNLLGHWHSLILELDRQSAADLGTLLPFQKALKELTATAPSQMQLAKDAGIPIATLKRWLAGANPQKKAVPMLRRLEGYFGLQPGMLVELARGHTDSTPTTVSTPPLILYRQRMSKNKLPYALQHVSDNLKKEWLDLLQHKVEVLPRLERQRTGKWDASEHTTQRESGNNWYCFLDGTYVAAAHITWGNIASYLGWLSLQQNNGGAGLEKNAAQNLGWLLVTSMGQAYLSWRIKRSAGIVHSGVIRFIQVIKSLTHPKTGYLTQSPHLLSALPPEAKITTSWADACSTAFAWAKKTLSVLSEQQSKSREPFEPVKAVLELAKPMEAVSDMIHRMKAARPAVGGLSEAVWARDLLLIKLLASNPLRAKNIKLLTYNLDNTGHLRQTQSGAWRIVIKPEMFKNKNGAAKNNIYDMPVNESAWGDIERYLKRYRPLLPYAKDLTNVFLSSEKSFSPHPWESLNQRVFSLTKQYLWRCPGAGPHVFRYINATAILKACPGEWDTAAQVLHDKVETVKKHYAHLRGTDGAERAHALLHDSFARM